MKQKGWGQKQRPDGATLAAPQLPACVFHSQCCGGPQAMTGEDKLTPQGLGLGPFFPDSSLSVFFLAQETHCLLV